MRSPKKSPKPKQANVPGTGQKFVDRDLCGVNPLSQQFEPTPESAIKQHKKMGGVE